MEYDYKIYELEESNQISSIFKGNGNNYLGPYSEYAVDINGKSTKGVAYIDSLKKHFVIIKQRKDNYFFSQIVKYNTSIQDISDKFDLDDISNKGFEQVISETYK